MKEEKIYKDIEIRSEEVQEVMTQIPARILQWGITIIFLIVLIMLGGCYWFKYPDKVDAEITLTTTTPPTYLVTKISGKVEELLVANGEEVKLGQPLALIENVASKQDVDSLKSLLKKWEDANYDLMIGNDLFTGIAYQLGEIQSSYAIFISSLKDYVRFVRQDYYNKKMQSAQEQLNYQRQYYKLIKDGAILSQQDRGIVHNMFLRDSLLYKDKYIAAEEFENTQRNYLQSLSSNKDAQISIIQTEMQIAKEKDNLNDIRKDWFAEEDKFQLNLKNAIEQLHVDISSWEQQYLLIAPIAGKLSYISIWNKNQWVNQGETAFAIAPMSNTTPIGKVFMPIQGSGKVKIGQQVHIKLNNYPDQEFGYLKGRVNNISPIPITQSQQDGYVVEVMLENGMTTNYNKRIPLTQDMKGKAEIITEDMRLIERLILPLKKIIRN